MSSRAYSFRLEGLSTPSGEISLRDLANIADALQLTATRIARQIGGQTGRGRSTGAIDRMSELRLSGIESGSTVLEIHLGDSGSLLLPSGDEETVAERFEAVFVALATNSSPSWADAPVKAAIGKVAYQVRASGAKSVTAYRGVGEPLTPWQVVDVGSFDLRVWRPVEERDTDRITMTGHLDKVDLRARRFRVRDDVGHDVTLEDVVDVDAAAQLIGKRVVASGVAEREQGRVIRIIEPVLVHEVLPADWFVDSGTVVGVGGAVVPGAITGIADREIDDFLAEIRG